MAINDWKKFRSKNPYEPYNWMNKKKRLWISIHYDIGFGKQRNVTIYNLANQRIDGFEVIKTFYCDDEKEAKQKATEYMRNN